MMADILWIHTHTHIYHTELKSLWVYSLFKLMVVQYIIIQSFKIMYYKNLIWSKKKKKMFTLFSQLYHPEEENQNIENRVDQLARSIYLLISDWDFRISECTLQKYHRYVWGHLALSIWTIPCSVVLLCNYAIVQGSFNCNFTTKGWRKS